MTPAKALGLMPPPATTPAYRRAAPLIGLGLVIAVAYALGLHRYLSLAAIAEHRDALKALVADNLPLALAAYAGLYVVVVALSLPGAAALSIAGGLLFGWAISAPVTVLAATAGAAVVFQIVRTSLGESIARRAGPFAEKLAKGFQRDAFNYLLFLRLVPAFPFFAVNAVAGLSGISLRTFLGATLIGIIPGSLAFAYLGAGLDSLIDAQSQVFAACVAANGAGNCRFMLEPSALITREIIIAFVVLGLVALLPVALKRLRGSRP